MGIRDSIYLKASGVGAAAAFGAVLVWMAGAVLFSFLKWRLYLRSEADFGGSDVLTLGSAALVALTGFAAGFIWSVARSKRLAEG